MYTIFLTLLINCFKDVPFANTKMTQFDQTKKNFNPQQFKKKKSDELIKSPIQLLSTLKYFTSQALRPQVLDCHSDSYEERSIFRLLMVFACESLFQATNSLLWQLLILLAQATYE